MTAADTQPARCDALVTDRMGGIMFSPRTSTPVVRGRTTCRDSPCPSPPSARPVLGRTEFRGRRTLRDSGAVPAPETGPLERVDKTRYRLGPPDTFDLG
ncbi:hypothetical protein ACFU53_18735 [Streptomyces sp. NPDC057474]|uniref:hypothetical protein n=1 Tax=Streptomyces sp. NPDC057474 TaxID=3346144 RepID=UPI0036B372AC